MRIKNWSKFQHFKDRRPPWIKLHREILEQRDINMISDCSFRVLVGLWLLASEDETMQGNLPDVNDIAFRLRLEKSKVIKSLQELKPFLYQDDINVISEQYQLDDPETETETEKESAFSEFWELYPRKINRKKAESGFNRLSKAKQQLAIADIKSGRFNDIAEQFIPHATTYINQERWDDEIAEVVSDFPTFI